MEILRIKNGHFIKYTENFNIFLNKDLYQGTQKGGQIFFFFFETLYIELQFAHKH
jgi:hypothetical protein